MSLIFEAIIELLGGMFAEGVYEITLNKDTPKWLRIILGTCLIIFISFVVLFIIILGITLLIEGKIGGIAFVLGGIVLLCCIVYRVYKDMKKG